ncbi:MAG: glycoside hydrolase family 3 protein [Deltaproteobacteria bacterium]|nr:glycoside hydrolase family 3 protein [Deltaproteobacteria bacterium]
MDVYKKASLCRPGNFQKIYLFAFIVCVCILATPSLSFSGDAVGENEPLDVKIGQMIMIGFRGLTVNDKSPVIADIKKMKIGGVILFDYDVPSQSPVRNIESPGQVRFLVSTLQGVSSIPLFIAIDQEGGKVNRLKEKFGFPPTVSEGYLGGIDDPEVTKKYAERTADTLAGLGINLNFAPVVDLNINPDNPVIGRMERSFSADPEVVIRRSMVTIDAFHTHGILSAIKHFPGHGSSTADSHKGFVDVTESWSPDELKPFGAIIQSGGCDMVMTAHIFNARLDPLWPATLSHRIIGKILRDDMGFNGVVVSDDMQMNAIRSFYGLEIAIKMAIGAGCDILVFANNSIFDENIAARAIDVIKKLVADGEIKNKRIDESYSRIMELKEKLKR